MATPMQLLETENCLFLDTRNERPGIYYVTVNTKDAVQRLKFSSICKELDRQYGVNPETPTLRLEIESVSPHGETYKLMGPMLNTSFVLSVCNGIRVKMEMPLIVI